MSTDFGGRHDAAQPTGDTHQGETELLEIFQAARKHGYHVVVLADQPHQPAKGTVIVQTGRSPGILRVFIDIEPTTCP